MQSVLLTQSRKQVKRTGELHSTRQNLPGHIPLSECDVTTKPYDSSPRKVSDINLTSTSMLLILTDINYSMSDISVVFQGNTLEFSKTEKIGKK